MTAVGLIDLHRSHGYCTDCRLPCFAADTLLGIGGFLTVRAQSMACLAGINDPFRKAGTLLSALAGWRICAETLRKCCHESAGDARERRGELGSLPEQFEKASGQDRGTHRTQFPTTVGSRRATGTGGKPSRVERRFCGDWATDPSPSSRGPVVGAVRLRTDTPEIERTGV